MFHVFVQVVSPRPDASDAALGAVFFSAPDLQPDGAVHQVCLPADEATWVFSVLVLSPLTDGAAYCVGEQQDAQAVLHTLPAPYAAVHL